MTSMLRMEAPKVGFANLGPRCAPPNPAPSPASVRRPLTKGALPRAGLRITSLRRGNGHGGLDARVRKPVGAGSKPPIKTQHWFQAAARTMSEYSHEP